MTDIRETLDEIQQRAPTAMDDFNLIADADDFPELWQILMDAAHMHAALRAVLEIIDKQPEYTCETSWLIGQIHQAINAALNGAQ